jgi:hypothetical protein
MPHGAVMALQKASPVATMLRRMVRSASLAIGKPRAEYITTNPKPASRPSVVSESRNSLFNRLDQHIENGTIEKVQRVVEGQQKPRVVSLRGYAGGSAA